MASTNPAASNTASTATATADFSNVRAAAGNPHASGAEHEAQLVAEGKMPGLEEAERLNHEERQPGEEDQDGDKIPHKHWLGRVLHREAKSANDI